MPWDLVQLSLSNWKMDASPLLSFGGDRDPTAPPPRSTRGRDLRVTGYEMNGYFLTAVTIALLYCNRHFLTVFS